MNDKPINEMTQDEREIAAREARSYSASRRAMDRVHRPAQARSLDVLSDALRSIDSLEIILGQKEDSLLVFHTESGNILKKLKITGGKNDAI